MPFLFLVVLGIAVNNSARSVGPPVFDTGFFVLLFALQCEQAVAAFLVKRERAGPLVRVRELIILLGFCYLLLGVVRAGSSGERFRPDLVYVTRLVMLAAGWLLSFNIHAHLRALESFYAVREQRTGSALHHAVREAAHVVGNAQTGLLAVRRLSNVFLVSIGLVILVLWLAGYPPGAGELFGYCLYCVCYVIVRSVVSISIDEIELAGDGLTLSLNLVRKRVRIAAISGGVALLFALFYAGDRSILPHGLLAKFFSWLGSLFSQTATPALPGRSLSPVAPPMPDIREFFGGMPAAKPLPWLVILWQVVRIAALAAGAAVVLIFIFGPLFSHDFRIFLRRINPLSALLNRLLLVLRAGGRGLRALVRAARRLFIGALPAEIVKFVGLTGPPSRPVFRPTRKKRLEIDRIRREFLRIVQWGETAGIHYADSLTANEYAAIVAGIRTGSEEDLTCFANLFDEGIYSPHELGAQKLRLLHESVDNLMRPT